MACQPNWYLTRYSGHLPCSSSAFPSVCIYEFNLIHSHWILTIYDSINALRAWARRVEIELVRRIDFVWWPGTSIVKAHVTRRQTVGYRTRDGGIGRRDEVAPYCLDSDIEVGAVEVAWVVKIGWQVRLVE